MNKNEQLKFVISLKYLQLISLYFVILLFIGIIGSIYVAINITKVSADYFIIPSLIASLSVNLMLSMLAPFVKTTKRPI